MPFRRRLAQNVVFVCLVVVVAPGARAQSPDRHGVERRMLGGHQFQPTRIRDAFVTTHVRTATGAGFATGLESPVFVAVGDTLGRLKGDLAFFLLELEYQQNLFDWGAVRVALSGSGRAGVDAQSILADGLTTIYGAVIEGKGAVLRRERSQVAVTMRYSRKSLFGLDPFGFAERIIENDTLTTENTLIKEGNIQRYLLGVAGTHAFKAWLGGNVFVEMGAASPILRADNDEFVINGGAAGDVDLLPLKGWPVGFVLAYDYAAFPEGGADVAKGIHSGTLGFNYTGRPDFHVGVEVIISTLKQTDIESTLSSQSFLLNMRYFF